MAGDGGIGNTPSATALRERVKRMLLGDPGSPTCSGIVCSEWWADFVISKIIRGSATPPASLKALSRHLWKDRIYPERERNGSPKMIVCPDCGRYCPPPALKPIVDPDRDEKTDQPKNEKMRGRPEGRCVDCVANLIQPSLLDELNRPDRDNSPTIADTLGRICFFRRVVQDDGSQAVESSMVFTADEEARRFVRDQERIERGLIKSESKEQLEAEIALYMEGKWKPRFEPARKPKRRFYRAR